ncbi:DNA cytosine methyltransferase, partial [Holdemanella biformis]
MIKLATVFSGIGAIEHALKRMNLKNEIVFACDNGDVEILTKNIGMDIDVIKEELVELKNIIKDIQFDNEVEDLYKNQLADMLAEAETEFNSVSKSIEKIKSTHEFKVDEILETLINMQNIKSIRMKEYNSFKKELKLGSDFQKKFKHLQIVLEIVNDYKKDNSIENLSNKIEFVSSDNIKWEDVAVLLNDEYTYLESINGKKIIRKVQDLSQRTSQLHEKINYLKVQKKLDSFGNDWDKRKTYVDSLYSGLEKRNKVKQSYMANYEVDDKNFHWNVAFLNGQQYRDQVDLFVGGSPCQSFSLVGKQRGLEDTRGTLFYEYARLIDEIKPKVFIYENVRAVVSHDNGKTWKKMQEVFSELGYNFSWKVLNAKDYGIPQNRERLFVVGFRNDLKLTSSFSFPEPIELIKKMKDFLMDNAPGGYFLPKDTFNKLGYKAKINTHT